MEAEALDAINPFPPQGDNPILDSDLYGADGFDMPDPGLLTEKNELYFTAPPQDLRTLTRSQRWQNMNPRARARQLWLLLRTGLHDIVEKEKRAELRVARLTHGLEALRCLEVAAGLRSVAQDPVGGRFVVLDGAGCLHLHREDGWAQEKLPAPIALSGLVTVLGPLGAVGRFVGWGPSGLAILGPDFSLLWLSEPGVGRAPGREPTCCLPVPYPGLLLVAEVGGGLELWKFRSGGRRLVPRGSRMRPTPNLAGPLMRLALGPAPPHRVPRCFAACGSTVLSFDLQAWALLDVRRDLHKTTISDLAYCEGADAMVTASRDSTVKVWEADWQIRMVFVGHTGPVTALAVLPNTTLLVSASQDGTLRTWDLQAAAQVGEVALCYWSQDVLSGRVSRLLAPARPGWPVLSLRASSVELWRVRELYSQLAQLPAPVLHLQAAPALPAPAPCHSAVARPWENKNRYLPVLGYTDGSLSVLEWRSSETVFRTEAHSPGPVTAVASTWNSVVSSGGDLTVKVWRVFPYTEESLSLLRTFSCCHPVVMLCALGTRVTIGFEDQDSATYGLVQFGLGNSQRCDHRPQDDPMDHITGLCCCPTLELYACSSLDCTVRIWTAENRLLRPWPSAATVETWCWHWAPASAWCPIASTCPHPIWLRSCAKRPLMWWMTLHYH
ncbi:PREDICTED: WD repeat-containing protein KIAA1875-like [Galeopterus variegatus]|uniref:WD repeat-containing protein KIAA1875-like n=1 Tax=Galeopterus variegatus TaxID=482537 RepID=A0ABM0QNI6_GALVR|nr:PREDICTED: WD repeat-containing protein KIAA1875-like [Galeopterus variegatus]